MIVNMSKHFHNDPAGLWVVILHVDFLLVLHFLCLQDLGQVCLGMEKGRYHHPDMIGDGEVEVTSITPVTSTILWKLALNYSQLYSRSGLHQAHARG